MKNLVDDNDRARMNASEEEEDRISNLPDDIIHHILSFLDMIDAMTTSALSQKWKLIWTTMPHLNFNTCRLPSVPRFVNFVKHVLLNRNNHAEVSAAKLSLTGKASDVVGKSIVEYAYSHGAREMALILSTSCCEYGELPRYFFRCHTLKNLTLSGKNYDITCSVPISTWDFPALESLTLRNFSFRNPGGDKSSKLLFKCVNLKDLTLECIHMYGVEIFHVCAPQLSNLTIISTSDFPKVFNVVAPELQNLTASLGRRFFDFLHFTTEGVESLEKVNLSLYFKYSDKMKDTGTQLLNLFQKLHSTKFLTLDVGIIQLLSSCIDQLLLEPCPFDDLKCLKIDTSPSLKQKKSIATIPTQVKNFLLHNSPSATFIMDLPQVAYKRSRKQVHKEAMAKKVLKCSHGSE